MTFQTLIAGFAVVSLVACSTATSRDRNLFPPPGPAITVDRDSYAVFSTADSTASKYEAGFTVSVTVRNYASKAPIFVQPYSEGPSWPTASLARFGNDLTAIGFHQAEPDDMVADSWQPFEIEAGDSLTTDLSFVKLQDHPFTTQDSAELTGVVVMRLTISYDRGSNGVPNDTVPALYRTSLPFNVSFGS